MSEEDKQKKKVYLKNLYQNMSEEEKRKRKNPKKRSPIIDHLFNVTHMHLIKPCQ